MNCVCDICVYHLGLCVFFPGVFLSSRVTGACPVTTDLIMRVNVRTTTTTTTYEKGKNTIRRPQTKNGTARLSITSNNLVITAVVLKTYAYDQRHNQRSTQTRKAGSRLSRFRALVWPWGARMSGDGQSRANVQRSRLSNRSFHPKT